MAHSLLWSKEWKYPMVVPHPLFGYVVFVTYVCSPKYLTHTIFTTNLDNVPPHLSTLLPQHRALIPAADSIFYN